MSKTLGRAHSFDTVLVILMMRRTDVVRGKECHITTEKCTSSVLYLITISARAQAQTLQLEDQVRCRSTIRDPLLAHTALTVFCSTVTRLPRYYRGSLFGLRLPFLLFLPPTPNLSLDSFLTSSPFRSMISGVIRPGIPVLRLSLLCTFGET